MGVAEAALERRVVVDRGSAGEVVHRANDVGRGAHRVRGRQAEAVAQRDRDRLRLLGRLPGRFDRLVVQRPRARAARPRPRRPPPASPSAARACGVDPWPDLAARRARRTRRSPRARCPARPRRSRARSSRRPGSGTAGGRRPGRRTARTRGRRARTARRRRVSWLPVPRRPSVCQVSRISSSSCGIAITLGARAGRRRRRCSRRRTRSACVIPLQYGHRPETTTPPSTRSAPCPAGPRPRRRSARGSPNSSARLSAGRYAASRLLVAAIDTHQPAEASPRAISSAHRSATPGASSRPPTSRGAPASISPDARRRDRSSSARRRWRSVSGASSRASAEISRAATWISSRTWLIANQWFTARRDTGGA